jgi:hypothetical protein
VGLVSGLTEEKQEGHAWCPSTTVSCTVLAPHHGLHTFGSSSVLLFTRLYTMQTHFHFFHHTFHVCKFLVLFLEHVRPVSSSKSSADDVCNDYKLSWVSVILSVLLPNFALNCSLIILFVYALRMYKCTETLRHETWPLFFQVKLLV